ncbi:hypothetical protein KW790_00325 [Candidatus Parcubacteria bacterium]|nr:hypothetical protein [Candidatus Parcubacteria bacterium]
MRIVGKRSALRTPEFHKKKEFQKKVRVVLGVVLLTLILVAPLLALRSKRLQIVKVEVKGNNAVKSEDVGNLVSKDLEGSFAFVIPKSSTLFYPEKKIKADLLSSFPRLSAATLALKGTHTISVSLEERSPVAIYCKDVSNRNEPQSCYFMDDSGFIFSDAAVFSGGIYPVFTSQPLLQKPMGQSLVSKEEFKVLMKIWADIIKLDLSPKYISRVNDEYSMGLASATNILWKSSQDESEFISNLDSFLHSSKTAGATQLDNLVYIDLRFTNKVFYKFRVDSGDNI